jgi:GH15 family glucan-1,4-alpha-glucosidase
VNGYIYRYSADTVHDPNSALPSEGAFTMCGFWLAQVYAALGRPDDAHRLFERLIATANDVGLFSEEFDVGRGIAIGNIPQAFSHAGLIDTAHALFADRPVAS